MTRRTFLVAALAAQLDGQSWSPIFEERFADESFRKRWMLEGEADLDLHAEDGRKFLRIATKQSIGRAHV